MNKKKTSNFEDKIIEDFKKNPKLLKEFKISIAKDYKKDKDLRAFKECLKLVIKAQRGLASKIAREANIDRGNIYKILSSKTSPRHDTLAIIMKCAGYEFDNIAYIGA